MSDYRLSDGMLAHYDSLFPDESRRVTRPSTREATARSIHRQESDRNYSQDPEEVYQRIYYSGPFINGIELPKDFAPGGYHPIHLQDELDDGRYRVIHKLGLTDYGVSWLCRDQHIQTPRYVTVNILTAERSELGNEKDTCQYIKDLYRNEPDLDRRFCLPVRDFTSQSANGAHLCLVYPVMGPPVDEAAFISRRRNITSLVDHTGGLDDAGDNVFLGLLHAHDDDYVNYREAGIYDEDDEWDDATDVGSEDEDRDSVDSGLEDMDTADPDTDDGDWHTEIVGPDYSAPGNSHMGWEELVRQHEEKEKEKQDSQFLRAICRDTAEAVALLHRRGLCHGGQWIHFSRCPP